MYIFGYGSLLWYTNFPYDEKFIGYVKGYARRFWQSSPDHRGTPEQPGRTVTLVAAENEITWGVVYKIAKENIVSVRAYLNFREKAGYELVKVLFYPNDTSLEPFEVEVYVAAQENNDHFVGPEPIDLLAERIVSCEGPSGTNIEYMLRVAHCIRELNPNIDEPHVFELEQAVISKAVKRGSFDVAEVLQKFGHKQIL